MSPRQKLKREEHGVPYAKNVIVTVITRLLIVMKIVMGIML